MAVTFNEFHNVLTSGIADDEKILFKVSAAQPEPEPEVGKHDWQDVRVAVYKPQKYYRGSKNGNPSFYVANTLFVAWSDGTTSCWVNARDVLRGIGYDTLNVKMMLEKYLERDANHYAAWVDISKYILLAHTKETASSDQDDTTVRTVGHEVANGIRRTSLFLTERGMMELIQRAPKCKEFRNSFVSFIGWIRQRASTTPLIEDERAAYESTITELRDQLNRAHRDRDQTVESMKAEVQRVERERVAAVDQLRQQHEELLLGLKKQHQAELDNLRAEQRVEIEFMKSSHASLVDSYRAELSQLKGEADNTSTERDKVTTELLKQQTESQELRTRVSQLSSKCDRLQRERERIYQEVTRYNFLYFHRNLVPECEQNVCVMVYIGKLRDYPEDRPRPGFWCIRGQRQHAKRVLEDLYTEPSSAEDSPEPSAKRRCTRNGSVHESLAKLGNDFKRCSSHLFHSDRKTGLDKVCSVDNDHLFNETRHMRVIMPCINPTLMVRMARYFDIAKRWRANERRNRYRDHDDYDDGSEDDSGTDLGPEFPFRQYTGYPNANLYVAKDEFARSPVYALKTFEAFASYYGSMRPVTFARAIDVRNDEVDLVTDDEEELNDDDDDDEFCIEHDE